MTKKEIKHSYQARLEQLKLTVISDLMAKLNEEWGWLYTFKVDYGGLEPIMDGGVPSWYDATVIITGEQEYSHKGDIQVELTMPVMLDEDITLADFWIKEPYSGEMYETNEFFGDFWFHAFNGMILRNGW